MLKKHFIDVAVWFSPNLRPSLYLIIGWILTFCPLGAFSQPLDAPRPIPAKDTVFLEELTWMEVRDAVNSGKTTVIVPTGGIEQSGPYLPLGKHNFILRAITEAIALQLTNTLVAPNVPFVPEGNIEKPDSHMVFPGTISVTEETFDRLLTDICESLSQHGFSRIILLGDSQGNQAGMARVEVALNQRWRKMEGKLSRVLFIPDYYNYQELNGWLESKGYHQSPEGIHDDLAFTTQLLAVDPNLIRATERAKTEKLSINGVSLNPISKFIDLGKEIMKLRVNKTVAAIRLRWDSERADRMP